MAKVGVLGATGQLGVVAVKDLVTKLGASNVVALVRSPEKAADLGVEARHADYEKPETLAPAFEGIEKLLFISSPDIGNRVRQHAAVLEAAKASDVKHVVYTSGLKTHTSKVVVIAQEDRDTEALLKSGGTPFTILRNGWYTENHMLSLAGSLEAGTWVGCAGTHAKFSCAPRADYATAAAAVLTSAPGTFEGRTVELAGDPEQAYTLPQLCEEISRQTGKQLPYQDVPLEDYVKVLASTGLPDHVARAYATFDLEAAEGGLYHEGRELSSLIGRPTGSLADVLRATLATVAAPA